MGIGKKIALEFAKFNCKLSIVDINIQEAKKFEQELLLNNFK